MERLFCFDVDGTLIPQWDMDLDPRMAEAFQYLLDQGDYIAIASGRPRVGCRKHLRNLKGEGRYLIVCNGAAIAPYEGKYIHGVPVSGKILLELARLFKGSGVTAYAKTADDGLVFFEESPFLDFEVRVNGIDPSKVRIYDSLEDRELPPLWNIVLGSTPEISKNIVLPKHIQEECTITRSNEMLLEVIAKGRDKAAGVEDLRKYLGINREDVYCFGDGINDVCMLKAYHGICPENGLPEAKEVAEYVCPPCEELGVLTALRDYLGFIE